LPACSNSLRSCATARRNSRHDLMVLPPASVHTSKRMTFPQGKLSSCATNPETGSVLNSAPETFLRLKVNRLCQEATGTDESCKQAASVAPKPSAAPFKRPGTSPLQHRTGAQPSRHSCGSRNPVFFPERSPIVIVCPPRPLAFNLVPRMCRRLIRADTGPVMVPKVQPWWLNQLSWHWLRVHSQTRNTVTTTTLT
jgi:hypothetical protein